MILDLNTRILSEGGNAATFTERECLVVEKLARTYPRRVRNADLAEWVWAGEDEPEGSFDTIKVHIWRARRRIAYAGIPDLIGTAYAFGYFLNRPVQIVGGRRMCAEIGSDVLEEIARFLSSHPDPRAAKVIARLPVVG